jgi:hypothetical protein
MSRRYDGIGTGRGPGGRTGVLEAVGLAGVEVAAVEFAAEVAGCADGGSSSSGCGRLSSGSLEICLTHLSRHDCQV